MLDHQDVKGRNHAIGNDPALAGRCGQSGQWAARSTSITCVPIRFSRMPASFAPTPGSRRRLRKQRARLRGSFWMHCLHWLCCLLSCRDFASVPRLCCVFAGLQPPARLPMKPLMRNAIRKAAAVMQNRNHRETQIDRAHALRARARLPRPSKFGGAAPTGARSRASTSSTPDVGARRFMTDPRRPYRGRSWTSRTNRRGLVYQASYTGMKTPDLLLRHFAKDAHRPLGDRPTA